MTIIEGQIAQLSFQTYSHDQISETLHTSPARITGTLKSIFRDLFRFDKIRVHGDAPEPWTASEGNVLLGLLKEVGTK
jgi:hypothetical protein